MILVGESTGDIFGSSTSFAGDINSDGFDDLIIGARLNDAGGNNAGRAYVYSGQTGALLNTFTGESADDFFGFFVSGAGGVNNDGFADLIVGAILNDAGGSDAGRAYVYSYMCCNLAGDANNDGSVNISDLTFLVARIFAGGTAPGCCEEGDADGSGGVNIADVTFLIARIFAGGPAPLCGPAGMGR